MKRDLSSAFASESFLPERAAAFYVPSYMYLGCPAYLTSSKTWKCAGKITFLSAGFAELVQYKKIITKCCPGQGITQKN